MLTFFQTFKFSLLQSYVIYSLPHTCIFHSFFFCISLHFSCLFSINCGLSAKLVIVCNFTSFHVKVYWPCLLYSSKWMIVNLCETKTFLILCSCRSQYYTDFPAVLSSWKDYSQYTSDFILAIIFSCCFQKEIFQNQIDLIALLYESVCDKRNQIFATDSKIWPLEFRMIRCSFTNFIKLWSPPLYL